MIIAITGANGFIGTNLARRLRNARHEVRAISVRRSIDSWLLDGCNAVIHLAGEPISQRWTAQARQRIMDSRVEGTRVLIHALEKMPVRPEVLISASAVGYYGPRGEEILTETSSPGNDFLAAVTGRWECEAWEAEKLGMRVVTPRFGVVLGKNGGALQQMLLPFKLGVGGRLGNGKQWMSWIHMDDLCALLVFAMEHAEVRGPVNAVAPNPVTNSEFTRALAAALFRRAIIPVPAFALKLLFGEMSQVLLEGQRVIPEAAERAGFQFQYPEIGLALRQILS